tara:strand:+ start:1629 stop:2612 length:984 start_codon:yes stop_codon:yes gene_type:complete
MKKKHLITGITGQDGIFLTSEILKNNPKDVIIGTSRNYNNSNFKRKLNVLMNFETDDKTIQVAKVDLLELTTVKNLISDTEPDYIYNLSGPSSVYKSLSDNNQTYREITTIFNNLAIAINDSNLDCNFFQASSSEMFAPSLSALSEESKLSPRSPYAEAKLQIHEKLQLLKGIGNINYSSGIMFNHESEFRGDQYLVMKIINFALKVKTHKKEVLKIGSLDLIRDWGYAGDVAEAIYKINVENESEDYVIGSGVGHRIEEILNIVFEYFKLNWKEYVVVDSSLLRKGDPITITCDPRKISSRLNWNSSTSLELMLNKCIEFKLKITD